MTQASDISVAFRYPVCTPLFFDEAMKTQLRFWAAQVPQLGRTPSHFSLASLHGLQATETLCLFGAGEGFGDGDSEDDAAAGGTTLRRGMLC